MSEALEQYFKNNFEMQNAGGELNYDILKRKYDELEKKFNELSEKHNEIKKKMAAAALTATKRKYAENEEWRKDILERKKEKYRTDEEFRKKCLEASRKQAEKRKKNL